MKYIYTNLKRFDIPADMHGVNRIAPIKSWAQNIVDSVQDELHSYGDKMKFTFFFPEAHIINAAGAKKSDSPVKIGCQSVHSEDVAAGGNFGAFTSNRPASAAKALGCSDAIIGHCEERRDIAGILAEAGVEDNDAVNRILNRRVAKAEAQGLNILYCIGETAQQQQEWQAVLRQQLSVGLSGIDKSNVVIAYEPVWAIGPGKVPPDKDYITKIGRFIKEETGGVPVVYGGGLKADNAAMLADIPEIDGGLIALTRFSGEIGFYPEEYLEIIKIYNGGF